MQNNGNQHDQLVERAIQGNRSALEALLVLHLDGLSAHITRRMPQCNGAFSAEDVTQDALLEAFLKVGRLQTSTVEAFAAWLKAVGELTLLRFIRDQSRLKRGGTAGFRGTSVVGRTRGQGNHGSSRRVTDMLDALPGKSKTASSNLARQESIAAMRVAIARLPEEQRRAIRLHILDGLSLQLTAQQMDRTTAALRGLLHRGKKKLAETICRVAEELAQQ